MNRTILIKKIAERLSIKEREAQAFVTVWEEELGKSLMEEDSITLMGFGTFSLWKQAGRPGRNPRKNMPFMIKPRNSVKFKPGKDLLEYLNNRKDSLVHDRRKKKQKSNNDNTSLDSLK